MQDNSPRVTIIDIINGIHKLQLYNVLPASQFTFFVGLICKANELGFKEELTLTNSSAMALAGVESRQSINRLRKALAKFKIDGEKILEFSHGNHFKNVAAKYKINYNLLVRQNHVWRAVEPTLSQKRDGSSDGSSDGSVPFHRSEKRRKENKDIYIPDLLKKLEFAPGVINISKDDDKQWFEYIKQFDDEKIDVVIKETKRRVNLPLSDKDHVSRKSVLKFIAGGLENYDKFYKQRNKKIPTDFERAIGIANNALRSYRSNGQDKTRAERVLRSGMSGVVKQYGTKLIDVLDITDNEKAILEGGRNVSTAE